MSTGKKRELSVHTLHHFKKYFLIITCLVLGLSMAAPAYLYAKSPVRKIIRVGWYDSSFHNINQLGRRAGYSYEYQQRIAAYTGWKYEYVEGSWSDLFEMLAAGEIDLLSDVSYTQERAKTILYSAESMGSEDYYAYISSDNTAINPDDFSTFDGKKIGVNKNSVQEQLFIEWAKSHDVHPQIIELSVKSPEALQMLSEGDIDILVAVHAYGGTADVIPVCKVGSSDYFFGVSRKRPDLKKDLDVAMNRIFEDNRNFNQQMTEKYVDNPGISGFLTADEKDWLSGHGTIRVGYRDNYLPFCGLDSEKGTLTGALADYLAFAERCEKNARLNFSTQAYHSTEDALAALTRGEIDCFFPVCLSSYDGEKLDVIITDPLLKTEMYVGVRSADKKGVSWDNEMKVAVIKGNPNYEIFLLDNFPRWKASYYEDSESAYQAVASGDADAVLISSYRLNSMYELCEKYKLSTLATGKAMDLSFAISRENDCLYSIINKVNRLMPDATMNASLTSHSFENNKVTIAEFLKDNLPIVLSGAAIILLVVLFLLLWNIRAETKASEGRRIISKTERDNLSSLYNRNYFILYAIRHYSEYPDKAMDAIIVNIERFHNLNTLKGRAYGDEVLRSLADAIEAFIREHGGIAARTEGDNFDIYCPHLDDYQSLLNRFQSHIDETFQSDIRLRMGIMPWQAGLSPEEMFDLARTACGMIRGDFKTHLMVYDEKLRLQDEYNQKLRNELGRALSEHQLEVYYQPKYDIRPDRPRLSSAEALVRWVHPELGLISPDAFIPLFERSGQISDVDSYVWEMAARQIADWRDRLGIKLPVSVNLSRVDVFNPDLPQVLDELIGRYGLNFSDLNLEVTESAYTDNADQLILVIRQLREKGYIIEMDDFGSGYSSLNMLSSMPIDVLKMDMGFIRNIERNERDFRLVELILDIAGYLKVPVIAEGVETENQLRLLRNAGCDIVQGYYFSRPLPADRFENEILKKESTSAL